ncbi:unnamed protein product [Microthlaspi erraticum]|uniref:Uncharacterized protein n=1 Tax=Microthlaspi erraticum TaxID=1685480 RepID=A0A6D2HIT2_9BRAS|nr:unnamed protein product [Microthlaspi erraticum]
MVTNSPLNGLEQRKEEGNNKERQKALRFNLQNSDFAQELPKPPLLFHGTETVKKRRLHHFYSRKGFQTLNWPKPTLILNRFDFHITGVGRHHLQKSRISFTDVTST